MANSYFKQEHDLEKRRAEAARIRDKYPDRIPVRMKLQYRAPSLHSIYLPVVLTIILIAFGLATALV